LGEVIGYWVIYVTFSERFIQAVCFGSDRNQVKTNNYFGGFS